MQNITNLFGAAGAARYLQLLANPVRYPTRRLWALNPDRSFMYDLTPYFLKSSTDRSDQTLQSDTANFSIANVRGFFDPYNGSATSKIIVADTILQYWRGLVDPLNGTSYLVPSFFGKINDVKGDYQRGNLSTLEVSVFDLMDDPLKIKITSNDYVNWEVNDITTLLATSYGGVGAANINLAPVNWVYPDVQFPEYALAECWQTLYDPLLFMVRFDESGNLVSAPRLGSSQSGYPAILGFPDATTPPPAGSVNYVMPDSPFLQVISQHQQKYNFVNQISVLGAAVPALITLGPTETLFEQDDSSINATSTETEPYYYSQHSSSSNTQAASNVYVVFNFSTNHTLDTTPQTVVLGVTALPAGIPAGTPFVAGGEGFGYQINNSDPHEVGFVNITNSTPLSTTIEIAGRQFSSGSPFPRHHGGFDYNFTIVGDPQLSFEQTLQQYTDYGVILVKNEALTDPYGDHTTYQVNNLHVPMAMSVPVIVSVVDPDNPLPSTSLLDATEIGDDTLYLTSGTDVVSGSTFILDTGASLEYVVVKTVINEASPFTVQLTGALVYAHAAGTGCVGITGISSADSVYLSYNFKVNYEAGTVVLTTATYTTWTADNTTPGQYSKTGEWTNIPNGESAPYTVMYGGTPMYSSQAIDTSNPAYITTPEIIYQYRREGDSKYVLPGLEIGVSYDVYLDFADPVYAAAYRRIFCVYINDDQVIQNLDIHKQTGGSYKAYQYKATGVTPDTSGNITIFVTQRNPDNGKPLAGCFDSKNAAIGSAVISSIRVLNSEVPGPPLFAIACGGPAYSPATLPTVHASYGYSPIQRKNGVQSKEINNPLLGTLVACKNVGVWNLNYEAWKRNQIELTTLAFPHLQPGDCLQFYNPVTNIDTWIYIPSIHTDDSSRPASSSGGGSNASDVDTITGYLLFVQPRTTAAVY